MPASSSAPPSQRAARKKRILLAIVLIPLATAAGLEVGARLIDRARGKPWDAEGCKAYLADACNSLSQRAFIPGGLQDEAHANERIEGIHLQPYTGWELFSIQRMMADDREYYSTPEADRAYDVLIFGGSVAQSFGNDEQVRLAELLRRNARFTDREVRIHSYGCAAFKQPQQLMFLSYALSLGHKPDVVIELDGFNESALTWSNAHSGAHPAYPHLPAWGSATNGMRLDWGLTELLHEVKVRQQKALLFGHWFLRSSAWRSCFAGHVLKTRFESLRRDRVDGYNAMLDYLKTRPQDLEVKGPRFPPDDDALVPLIVTIWEECSRSMHALCAERGIAYLHVLQPTLYDDGSKPLTERELAGASIEELWLAGVKRFYSPLRKAGAGLAQRGIAFFDATGIFRDHPEDVYIDACHLNEHGNDVMADAVAAALLETFARKN